MIRVDAQPEPGSFNNDVRQKGMEHLKKKKIALDQPLPMNANIYPYWRACLDDLHRSYRGTCAYLGIHFERVTGGASVDHFIAKSKRADLAYEWANYRLACSTMNSRKREYEDVLDPFTIENGWFHLELVSGMIYPNPKIAPQQQAEVQATIDRLGLDDGGNRELRARHYQDYIDRAYTAEFMERYSPFVWAEARRQGLL